MVKGVKLIEINDQSSIHMKHFTVGFFNTIHSIPDSLGILDQHAQRTHRGRPATLSLTSRRWGHNADYQVMAYMGADRRRSADERLHQLRRGGFLHLREEGGPRRSWTSMRKTKRPSDRGDLRQQRAARRTDPGSGRHLRTQGVHLRPQHGKRRNDRTQDGHHQHSAGTISWKPEQLNHTPSNKICIVCTGDDRENRWRPFHGSPTARIAGSS